MEADLSKRNQLPLYREFAHLSEQAISITDAEQVFGIPKETISSWVKKGFIRLMPHDGIHDRRITMINQQDVAYCARVYHEMGGGPRGKRIFNPDGTPWQPKPGLPRDPEARRQMGILALEAAKETRDLRTLAGLQQTPTPAPADAAASPATPHNA